MCVVCVKQAHNQERAVSWATWLKTQFRGQVVHLQPPTFCGFKASKSPKENPRPPNEWSLGAARGKHSPRTVGANSGSTVVPGAKKKIFSKGVPGPLGMLEQILLGRFEPVVARFGPWEIPKCLENGPFQDKKWVKTGSKKQFSKMDPRTYGMLKQVFLAHFEAEITRFGPWKRPKCLENWPLWDQKCVQNGSKARVSINISWTTWDAQTSVFSPF